MMGDMGDGSGPDIGEAASLTRLSTPDLVERAGRRRDDLFGTRVTYSPKVFIPLTTLCRDRCGYCTFAESPRRAAAPFLDPQQVLDVARRGAAAVLIGDCLDIDTVGRAAGTIGYEILTGLGSRYVRTYVG